jgi:hypothetical protein
MTVNGSIDGMYDESTTMKKGKGEANSPRLSVAGTVRLVHLFPKQQHPRALQLHELTRGRT